MGAPDPWADLANAVGRRKKAYLEALVIPFTAGKVDEEKLVTAERRGYLLGRHFGHDGKRPTATPQEQQVASQNANLTWFESPARRSIPFDPVGAEDVNVVNARLTVTAVHPDDPAKFDLPKEFSDEPPGLGDTVNARQALAIGARLGCDVIGDVRNALLGAFLFVAFGGTDLVDAIVGSLTDVTKTPPPPPPSSDPAVLRGIRVLLPTDLVDRVLAVAGAIGWDPRFSDTPAPLTPLPVEQALGMLSALGQLTGKTMSQALVGLADIVLNGADQAEKDRITKQPFDFAVIHNRRALPMPADFSWPTWDHLGFYWWRAVLLPHCVEHVLSWKDTADFHATDLLRFGLRFGLWKGNKDQRVPDYVGASIKLCLRRFKYWYDQTPAGHDWEKNEDREMTFWSENHEVLFGSSEFLAGQTFPDDEFVTKPQDSTATTVHGEDHRDWARVRLITWLDHRLAFGFSEWRSPTYLNEDLPPLINLAEFAEDTEIKKKAAICVDLLMFDFARLTCGGSYGNTTGRGYFTAKSYGWGQSIGETVELLFGSRGDFLGGENTAIALATSGYEVPEVILAIGRDRSILDRTSGFTDRVRVGITLDEAPGLGLGFTEDNAAFWWAVMAYFDHMLETTKDVARRYGNLAKTPPFKNAFLLGDSEFTALLEDAIEAVAGAGFAVSGAALAIALPFPIDLLGFALLAVGLEGFLQGIVNLIGDVISDIGHFLGFGDKKKKHIAESSLQKALDQLLIQFNQGSVLSRANIVTHSIGDAMLSSVQNHLPGQFSFQKQAWQATLDTDACVWTTAPFTKTDTGSLARGWLEFLKDLGELRPLNAFLDIGVQIGPVDSELIDQFSDDGPNYWLGSTALPMVVQHERAAIVSYNLSNKERTISAAATHAWFPRDQFDDIDQQDAAGGTWTFGRRGQGFIALFSARKVSFTTDGEWAGKELKADGGANIWICHIGNQELFTPPLSPQQAGAMNQPDYLTRKAFEIFKQETTQAYLNISGVGSWNQLEASFDIPRATAPDGRSPRLELFHGDGVGRFAGHDLQLDEFPRYQNQYVNNVEFVFQPAGGLSPQIQRARKDNTVAWGSRSWTFAHEPSGLYLTHDLDRPSREFNRQSTTAAATLGARRLVDGSLTTVRRRPQPIRRAQWLKQPG